MTTLPFSLPSFVLQQVTSDETLLTLTACATSPTATCPFCQQVSHRIHRYYTRSPHDLPISGRMVQLVLRVRRFRCPNPRCLPPTFAERLPELPVSARQTARLATLLDYIAVVLSGQAGSQLTKHFAMPVSPDTLLRRAKKAASSSAPTPRVLGVDDFAFRRGRTYGTLLLDLETHQPVDVLPDRSAESLAKWLKQHSGVEVVSRDRSTEYLRGATEGAPQAQQVLDRWHVLKNIREAVERFLSRVQTQLNAQGAISQETLPRQRRTRGERARSEEARLRRLALYQAVVELHQQGESIQGIAKQLQISRPTVYTFLQAPRFPEWKKVPRTKSAIDPYRPHLFQRWQEGCRSTDELWHEVQQRGFAGSRMMVYRWVQLQTDAESEGTHQKPPMKPTSKGMTPRQLAWLLVRDPERMEKQERLTLSLIQKVQSVDRVYALVQQFVTMFKTRNAQALDGWLEDCQTSGIPELATFAQTLEKEVSTLRAALILPYSNGPVEGKINKLKSIKRSMYGRGGFPLLRQRVLKAA
ncbi:MAG: ISL3 family transposase [Ktedonobacteraceae bacterium]|nr:ISL3 family transposase [Ktedonobacteraceae bacterium]